jgi:peptidoglycan/xylan/chitin deacetylase (PgdA/CDA1 family)
MYEDRWRGLRSERDSRRNTEHMTSTIRLWLAAVALSLPAASCSIIDPRVVDVALGGMPGTAGASGAGAGGSGGIPDAGDDGEGGSASGGSAGSGATDAGFAGSGGVTEPGRSGLPVPGPGGIAQPSGVPGNLRVLDWAGFRAAVSYTFDDSNSSQIQNYGALQALGVPLTFYLQTGKASSTSPVWAQAALDGHELGNHTRTHQSTGPDIAADTDAATTFIEDRFGVRVWTMAAPYGAIEYADVARTRFLINRGVSDQQIEPNGLTDPFNLGCYIPPEGTTTSVFNDKVDAVRAAGNWQVMLVHGFTGGSDSAFQPVPLADFLAGVEYAKSLGDLWIDSLVTVAAYWRGQRTFTSVTPSTANGITTWQWTLPDHFPSGQYLRVAVDGGTLTQGDSAPLIWDEHGYYEVALDLGSLTLAP